MKTTQMEVEDQILEMTEGDPMDLAPWYVQLSKLDPRKRKRTVETAMQRIRETKPTTYEFIKNFRCELVGIMPRIEYMLVNDSEGDTYVHSFSMPTLLFWCPKGEFSFFVNANLKYNDTVLNSIEGNTKENIRGFTG